MEDREFAQLVGAILHRELEAYCKRMNIKFNLKVLSELISIKRITLYDLLHGKSASVDMKNVKKICLFMGKPGGYIMDHEEVNALMERELSREPAELSRESDEH